MTSLIQWASIILDSDKDLKFGIEEFNIAQMKACSPCCCDGLKKAYKYTQKLSTDVRKRFRQVVNSLGIKIFLIKAGKIIYPHLLCVFETLFHVYCGKAVKTYLRVWISNTR